MKRIYLLLVLAITATASFAQKTINDPNVTVRDLKGFTAIKASSAFDIYITQGTDEAVAVSATDSKYTGDIKTEVTDGVLRIWFDQGKGRNWNTGKLKLKAYIAIKDINKLDVSGACDVYIEGGLKLDDLKVVLSGASDVKGKLDVQKLEIDMSGASDMTVSGSAGQLNIESSGASNFKGFNLVTEFCEARASGASDIKITVNKELKVQASGASDVDYKGEAVIRDLRTSGASSVSKSRS